MPSKYERSPRAKKTNLPNTDKMDNTIDKKPDENIYEKHKEFRESAKETVSNNEPVLETDFKTNDISHPFETPTIERDYTDSGIKKDKTQTTTSSENKPPIDSNTSNQKFEKPPIDTINGNSNGNTSQSNQFEPTPPPNDDEFYAEQHTPNEGTGNPGESFNIPNGSAEDLIDFGANALNFVIGNFAGIFVHIKIKPEYYSIGKNNGFVNEIKQFNESSVEKLKLDSEDISMLKKPLVKLLQEKGIRGLTPSEELVLAIALVAAKKVKAVVEIKKEAKGLQSYFDNEIRKIKVNQEPEKKEKIEEVEVEEVN